MTAPETTPAPGQQQRVTKLEAAAKLSGIPADHIKAAKALACPAYNSSGKYDIELLKTWYAANKDKVTEYLDKNKDSGKAKSKWKDRKERAQALIAEIDLADRSSKTLDKDKTIAFLKQIASSQAIVLKNQAQELPHKLLGKNITDMQVILAKSYDDVCGVFNGSLDKWTKQH